MAHDGLTGAMFDEFKRAHAGELTPYESAPVDHTPDPGPGPGMAVNPELAQAWLRAAAQATAEIAEKHRTELHPAGRVPAWARGRTAKTAAWTCLTPTLVTGCANLTAHYYSPLSAGIAAGALFTASLFGAVYGLNHKWGDGFTGGLTVLSVGSLSFWASAAAGGWMEVVSWAVAAGGTFGVKLLWDRKREGELADLELKRARTEGQRITNQGLGLRNVGYELDNGYKYARLAALAAAQQPAPGPALSGATAEEGALRRAFWDVFGEDLLTCTVTQTLSGWKATVGLSKLSRKEARNGWDKVQTAMRADGRFVVSEGRVTNELWVKFVSATAQAGHRTTWSESVMPPAESLRMSLGVDTETGDEVQIQFDERLLITGASGTGKSWSTRPLMAHAHLRGELLLIDGKGEESNIWDGVCRTATDTPEVVDAINYAHGVMTGRKTEMKSRGLSVWDGEQLTVNIDEGQVVLAALAGLKKGKDETRQKLIELSSLGRSRGTVVWWQTQYGVTSGDAPGIDRLIAPNMLQRFSLRVANSTHAQVALDDCAYYEPQSIPDDRAFRGHGYLQKYGPTLIRTWTLDDDAVRALPRKSPAGSLPFGASPEEKVAQFLAANPGASKRDVAAGTGVPEGSVQRLIQRVRGAG